MACEREGRGAFSPAESDAVSAGALTPEVQF